MSRTTSEFANNFKVVYRSSNNRLKELEKLGLVRRLENKKWIKHSTIKKLKVV